MITAYYPALKVYFTKGDEAFIQHVENIAKDRGLGTSLLIRRMIEACLPLLETKVSKGKKQVVGKINMNMMPRARSGKRNAINPD